MGRSEPDPERRRKAAAPPLVKRVGLRVEQNPTFRIVGMGGSAGGLEAFGQFFAQLPPDTGMAFVLVSHLDPTHKTLLAELLQRTSQIEITEIEDGVLVQPNAAYVIPPNADLAILHGKLHLLAPSAPRGLRMPIDFFFRQLAVDQRQNAVCVVFSGMGSDGALGLRAIKENSGLVMVQEPASAKYDAMPRSAINTGLADIVAPADELPARLIRHLAHATGLHRQPPPLDENSAVALQKIFILLRANTGNDFSCYKPATILRRIERRMSVHQVDGLARYIRFLQQNPQEIELLSKELLIGVTHFFRDPGLFEFLRETALPTLLQERSADQTLRVWTPACSTGEETYSIAIVIKETLEELGHSHRPIQIFGTDIDRDAIEKARQGIYSARIATDVSSQRLERFFVRNGEGYRISKQIRDMVVFAQQNLLVDPPFTKLDMLSCRNFFIYLKGETQKKLMPLIRYALGPGGILILGSAEGIGAFDHRFSSVDNKWRVFRRQETIERPVVEIPPRLPPCDVTLDQPAKKSQELALDITYIAQRFLLDIYAPPSVVINSEGDIVYVNGRTGQFLEPASGKINLNVFAMAREGLREKLVTAVAKARNEQIDVTVIGAQVKSNGQGAIVNLIVRPLFEQPTMRGMLLVIFEELARPRSTTAGRMKKQPASSGSSTAPANAEENLRRVQELLQAAVEEKEATQEELHSVNEELQSNNEELQSTNEELTSSKEELQSLNEEMQSVNAELREKLDEQSQSNNDMKNLLDGIEIATVFLDDNLCVKRFTPQAVRIFNLIPSDIGRPLADLVTKLKYNQVIEDARETLETLAPKQTQVEDRDGRWYQVRVLPYRTSENVIDGVVSTFTDITVIKRTEAELRRARRFAESVIATVREPLVVLDGSLRIISASRSFYETFNVSPAQTEDRMIYEIGDGQWNIPALKQLLEGILQQHSVFEGFSVKHDFPKVGYKSLLLNARRIEGDDGEQQLMLLAMEDITE